MSLARRQRNVLEFTLSSLMRRKGRNASLVLVYTVVVFMLASVMFFTNALRREAASVLVGSPEIVVQRMAAGRHDLMPVSYIETMGSIRGVSSATGRLWGYYFDPVVGANYTLIGISDTSMPFDYGFINDTGPPDLSSGEIIIGGGVSHTRNIYVGDLLPLRNYGGEAVPYRVRGVLAGETGLVSSDLMLMAEGDLRDLFGLPEGYVTDVAVKAKNPRELATIAGKIADALPDTRPIVRDEILRTYDAVFNWRGGMMVVVLFGAVLAFVIFAWDRASGLTAEERREMGILKAVGWETSDVMLMKLQEGAVVSLSAFLMGVILAYVHVFFASSALFGQALKGWSILYPDFALTPSVDLFQVSTLFFLTVVPYTVATIVPSWRAATVDPDSVMRE